MTTDEPESGLEPGSTSWHGEAIRFSRGDFVLMRRSAREKWGVPDELKGKAIIEAWKLIADSDAKSRDKLAAMKFLATVDRTDQADDHKAQQAQADHPHGGTVEVSVTIRERATIELDAWRKEMTERLALTSTSNSPSVPSMPPTS